jgi:hypothetical protein
MAKLNSEIYNIDEAKNKIARLMNGLNKLRQ